MLSDRPDILAAMAANRFRVIIYEDDGCRGPFQVPELSDDLPPGRCTNTVGIASLKGLVNRYTGEVLLVIEAIGVAPAFLPYCNFIFVHEFAHLVDYTLSFRLPASAVYDPNFEPRVKSAYNAAIAAGLYPNAYAATNHREYWAEAVTFWFLPDMLTGQVRTPAHVAQLADYDPRVVSLVKDVFRDAALPDCNPVFFRVLGTVTGPDGNPLPGVKVISEVRVVPSVSPYYWYFIRRHPAHTRGRRICCLRKQTPSRGRPEDRPPRDRRDRPRFQLHPGRRPRRRRRLYRRLPQPRRRQSRKHTIPPRRPIHHPQGRPPRHLPHPRPQLRLDPTHLPQPQHPPPSPKTNPCPLTPISPPPRPPPDPKQSSADKKGVKVFSAPLRVLRGSKGVKVFSAPLRVLRGSKGVKVFSAPLRVLRGQKGVKVASADKRSSSRPLVPLRGSKNHLPLLTPPPHLV